MTIVFQKNLTRSSCIRGKIRLLRQFEKFFPAIKKGAMDERNFVKKAVNWALRQIGKRNLKLNRKAISLSKEIMKVDSKSAGWIASDALRELEGNAVQARLKTKV